MRLHGTETYSAWLMCTYLHAATSSAMKDPLTGLTGLEIAVTQLRRCYVNKPFDKLCQKISFKIEALSVRRSYAYDENRSGYSSSKIYSLLVHCIVNKSNTLASLHDVTDISVSMLSKLGAALKGYERYERIYSIDTHLNAKEKQSFGYSPSKAPKLEYLSCGKRYSSPVYKVMHAFRCRKEFKALDLQSGKTTFFPSYSQPPQLERPLDRHIGT